MEKFLIEVHHDKEEISCAHAATIFLAFGSHFLTNTDWLGDVIARDSHGFILSGPDIDANRKDASRSSQYQTHDMHETSSKGIFVAGDVRHGSVKRVGSGVGEGSMAVMFVHQYLNTV